MATPPDFSSGAIMTAAQMNAVGLWLVKKQTIGTAVTSVQVTGAFSADFDNYKIILTGGASTDTFASLNLTFGSTVTGYDRTGFFMIATPTFQGFYDVNVTSIVSAGIGTPNGLLMNADIYTPFLARPTGFESKAQRQTSNNRAFWTQAFVNNSTSYTGFTLTVSAGTITGGTIRIYGYRN